MYYKLDEKYGFRGWKKLPYALRRMDDMGWFDKPMFLNKPVFMTVLRCNGVEDIDVDALDETERRVLDELTNHGIAKASEEPMGRLESYQRYRVYDAPYLDTVHWSITGRCNYRCRHCLMSAPDACHPQLPLEDLIKMADQFAQCGIRSVDVTGGEPLVRRDFLELVRALSERRIGIRTLYTNTKLLTSELLDQMKELGQVPQIQLSYDGYGHHDWLRGVKGAEEEAKAACELLGQRGYNYVVAACVHKGNKDSLRDLWHYLAEHGCSALRINTPQELGVWKEYSAEYALSSEEAWELYQGLIGQWYEDGMPIGIELDGFFSGHAGKLDYAAHYAKRIGDDDSLDSISYCEAMHHFAYVSPEGRLVPCMGFADSPLGETFPNILEEGTSFSQVALDANSIYRKVVDTRVSDMVACTEENPECATCEHLRSCLGGCMLEGTTPEGNYLHRDERCCWFFKNVGEAGVDRVAKAAIERYVPNGLEKLAQERASKKREEQPENAGDSCQ